MATLEVGYIIEKLKKLDSTLSDAEPIVAANYWLGVESGLTLFSDTEIDLMLRDLVQLYRKSAEARLRKQSKELVKRIVEADND